MPLQDANPTPSFGGFGLREYFLDAWERYTPYIGETPETPKHFDRFETSDASECFV